MRTPAPGDSVDRKVVLLSGGVESVGMRLEPEGQTLVLLFVDYAQKGAEMEKRASKSACDDLWK